MFIRVLVVILGCECCPSCFVEIFEVGSVGVVVECVLIVGM